LVSLGFTCSHLVSLGFTWFHLVSLGFTWCHLVSLGLTLSHLDSLDSLGLTWTHLDSPGLTWTHLDSLDSLDHPREKGRPPGAKGKREGARPRFRARISLGIRTVRARRTKRNDFPVGWTHPPNLRYTHKQTHHWQFGSYRDLPYLWHSATEGRCSPGG